MYPSSSNLETKCRRKEMYTAVMGKLRNGRNVSSYQGHTGSL